MCKGHVIFVGTDSRDLDFYEAIADMLAAQFSIAPLLDVPPGIEVVSRRSVKTKAEYLFLMNWSSEPRRVSLPRPYLDRANRQVTNSFELASLDAAILT